MTDWMVGRGAFTGNIRLYLDGEQHEFTPGEATDMARELVNAVYTPGTTFEHEEVDIHGLQRVESEDGLRGTHLLVLAALIPEDAPITYNFGGVRKAATEATCEDGEVRIE